jgi:DMSO/TMAO reductase YedYZ molybdopterin-dependent catalytic subunit
MASIVSRGFRGRRASDVDPARVPPGQYVTRDFPVLSAGPTPHTALELWDFSIVGELDEPRGWTWEQFRALPSEEITRDIHCVTKWSKLDTVWRGVSVDTLLEGIETSAEYVTAYSDGGYTTNLPLEDVTGGKRGSCSPTKVNRSRPSTAAPHACSFRTTTSGRAPSG